jgi:hypothetical protein
MITTENHFGAIGGGATVGDVRGTGRSLRLYFSASLISPD